jgi:hypothetical protein
MLIPAFLDWSKKVSSQTIIVSRVAPWTDVLRFGQLTASADRCATLVGFLEELDLAGRRGDRRRGRPLTGRAGAGFPVPNTAGRKVISRTGSGALAAPLLHASADHRKIVSGAGSGHVSSFFF